MKKIITAALLMTSMLSAAWADGMRVRGQVPQQPPPGPDSYLFHNGSLMGMIRLPNGVINIIYVNPRPEMMMEGVEPGTLLVDGRWVNPQLFQGLTRVFLGGCGAIPYRVNGMVEPGSNYLILQGPAPIVTPYCQVIGLAWTNNSRTVFQPAAKGF